MYQKNIKNPQNKTLWVVLVYMIVFIFPGFPWTVSLERFVSFFGEVALAKLSTWYLDVKATKY